MHNGGQNHDKLNLHGTIIVSVFFITINDNMAYGPIPTLQYSHTDAGQSGRSIMRPATRNAGMMKQPVGEV